MYICNSCSRKMEYKSGQFNNSGSLVWHESSRCTKCGNAIEVDGHGIAPDRVRDRLIQMEGTWDLVVELPVDLPPILKSIRQLLGLSLHDTSRVKCLIPGPIITGTKTEMEWLQYRLGLAGFDSIVSPSSGRENILDITSQELPHA